MLLSAKSPMLAGARTFYRSGRNNAWTKDDFWMKIVSAVQMPDFSRFGYEAMFARAATGHQAKESGDVREHYDRHYYTADCGGFDDFNRFRGKVTRDPRLTTLLDISSLKHAKRVLDLGCGRGELTYEFAKAGCEVTAVDYSESSIELARSCFDGEESLLPKVKFLLADVCSAPIHGQYDLAVAADLIEHLAPAELDTLFARVSRYLRDAGVFAVHTFPNLWFYKHDYPRRRREAAARGEALPTEPRSHYERLMHINEQSPAVLNKQLRRAFKHVLVWLGGPSVPGGSLLQKCGVKKLCAFPDIYAVASKSPLDVEAIRSLFQTARLPESAIRSVTLEARSALPVMRRGQTASLEVALSNTGDVRLSSYPPHPVQLSYHWHAKPGGEIAVKEGLRTRLSPSLDAHSSRSYAMDIQAPEVPGHYLLSCCLVQEFVRWHDDPQVDQVVNIRVMVE